MTELPNNRKDTDAEPRGVFTLFEEPWMAELNRQTWGSDLDGTYGGGA